MLKFAESSATSTFFQKKIYMPFHRPEWCYP